jgi:hypothetical protein
MCVYTGVTEMGKERPGTPWPVEPGLSHKARDQRMVEEAEVRVFKDLELDLPERSIIYADKAYTDYDYQDLLEGVGLHLKTQRKENSKRPMTAWEEFLGKPVRQSIETVLSVLSSMLSKKIHAVTPRSFELKIV